jgi:hypothetical protein
LIVGQRTDGNPAVGNVKDFHELKVWQKAHELTLAVYRATVSFHAKNYMG